MKWLFLFLPFFAHAANFQDTLAQISDTHWKGTFTATAKLGRVSLPCEGPIKVRFFPQNNSDMPGELPTVSYRHDADFSKNIDPLCYTAAKYLSVVHAGSCADFPRKKNLEHGQSVMVPYRTIIPRNNGATAVISAPMCKAGKVERSEVTLQTLALNGDSLVVQIQMDLGPLSAVMDYELVRCQPGDDCI